MVTWTAFPPASGSGVILSNLLKQFDPGEIVLAGEHTYGADINKYSRPNYPFYLLEHPFHTGVKGSTYLKWLSFTKVKRQLIQIIQKHQIDLVFGVFPDEFYTYVASRAALEREIPFYSWFHNTYLDNRSGILGWWANKIQPKIFRQSEIIFTMSEGMNDFFKKGYPFFANKMHPLLHGFDIPNKHGSVDVEIQGSVKHLLTGNINHSNKDSTARMVSTILSGFPDHEIHYYGGANENDWSDMGITNARLFIHGFIPLPQLVAKFHEYDTMLLPHGFEGNFSEAEYLTIFPTRTIPLLYSGKPIFAHSPAGTTLN